MEMHHGPAAYVMDPPPARNGDVELEDGQIWRSTWNTYLV